MTSFDPILLQFWGKTPKPGDLPGRYHPAIFHMLDVAFVAEALLDHGAPRLRRALLHAWDGCDPEALIAWMPFLIATHDLGKISAAFQGQAKREDTQKQRDRLHAAGVAFSPGAGPELYHAEVSAVYLHQHLLRREPGASKRLMVALRDAMGGHHGRFTQTTMEDIRKRLMVSERAEPRWTAWRDATYTLLHQLLAPTSELAALGAPRRLQPATAILTGLVVWSDWMGSNEFDFPATPQMSIEEYCKQSRTRAAAALDLHKLRGSRSAPTYDGFGSVFTEPPRPLQSLIDQLPVEDLYGPLLAVIEAPTGEGKTEAALALARCVAAQNGIDEIFFALPTMATGNQMFTRLEHFYHQRYGAGGTVRLTHSQAPVVEAALRRQVMLANDTDCADKEGQSADAAIQWFAGPKKAMLAPFGVGTVDQVELAGLNVRHYSLRLFGLAGKVVVIDEIHAYDAYMNTILEHTLTWLASLGCSVILLSATLPTKRHELFAAAFLHGLGASAPIARPAELPYPSLALYHAVGQRHETCAVFRGEQRFTIQLEAQRESADEAELLLDLVREGGAVARLCNRVDDAQRIYAALRERIAPDSSVLLHARFPLRERKQYEGQIDELVGKHTTRTADQPIIIVGTQVLEQSLDYDVDVMISDFAPIDLLLQRAGRLHRHQRQRPAGHAAPLLRVTLPLDSDGRPDWRRWKTIYAPYILWRSWQALRDGMQDERREIVLPRDYRPLIEAVYAETNSAADGTYADEVEKARVAYLHETNEQQSKGRQPLIPSAIGDSAITEHVSHHFSENEAGQAANWQLAKTRLGDRITLVPVYRVGDTLTLDPCGTIRISQDVPPDLEQQKEMLAYAVPLSDRRVIAAYRDERRPRELCWPKTWGDVPALLRSLYPLPLDYAGVCVFGNCAVRLDKALGLVIETGISNAGMLIEEDL